MSEKEVPEGLVICLNCQKTVPDSNICAYCGNLLKKLYIPRLTPMELKVLKCLEDGERSIDNILDCAGGVKESVRVVTSSMLKLGLVRRVKRGRYTLTEAGKRGIEKGSKK